MTIAQNPVELLQKLIRFNTTNPPGNESECINYLSDLLEEAGFKTKILAKKPERPNLVARLEGSGEAPPLLMYGHVDVVTTNNQDWKYPPFDGIVAEGCVWGRGALDMKGALAMMISAMIRMKSEGIKPKGDIILAVVCDEEEEGEFGAEFLIEEHSGLFKDVRYAIGEVGGFSMFLEDREFYPIMVAEKQKCTIKAVIKGPSGHGSLPLRNGAMAKLGRVLIKLNKSRLPVHITPIAKQMIIAFASSMQFPAHMVLKQLLNPIMTNLVIDLLGANGKYFESILHNTVNATKVSGGDKVNVIPGEIIIDLDGRLLPGFKPQDLIDELKNLVGDEIELEVITYVPGPGEVNLDLFKMLSDVLIDADPHGIPVPFLISATTDARFFSRLGIQTYGFTPMKLPKGMDFAKLIHAADERIPSETVEFGSKALFQLMKTYDLIL